MTWISLVCLLALSSSVFGRSVPLFPAYGGGYGGKTLLSMPKIITTPRVHGYDEEPRVIQPVLPKVEGYNTHFERTLLPMTHSAYGSSFVAPKISSSQYGQDSYSSLPRMLPQHVSPLPEPIFTQADILCRGQAPETVIPLEGNRKWVTCLDDGKGVEQVCPGFLIYVHEKRRCESRTPSDPCALQPCFNGGQCIPTEFSFQCQCPSGFGGFTCELDTQVCERQQPCGSSPGVICQSFRTGAALEWVCLSEEGLNYGENSQLVHSNPCQGFQGPHKLAYTNKGFIMCDGERMSIESCPGGTIWDDLNKACSWPDVQPVLPEISRTLISNPYEQKRVLIASPYEPRPKFFTNTYEPKPKLITRPTYGGDYTMQKPEVIVRPFEPKSFSTYGELPTEKFVPLTPKFTGPYGPKITFPEPEPKITGPYGSEIPLPRPEPKITGPYGSEILLPRLEPKVTGPYGPQIPMPRPEPKLVPQYGGEREELVSIKQTSTY